MRHLSEEYESCVQEYPHSVFPNDRTDFKKTVTILNKKKKDSILKLITVAKKVSRLENLLV